MRSEFSIRLKDHLQAEDAGRPRLSRFRDSSSVTNREVMTERLKILVSAVRSRPCPLRINSQPAASRGTLRVFVCARQLCCSVPRPRLRPLATRCGGFLQRLDRSMPSVRVVSPSKTVSASAPRCVRLRAGGLTPPRSPDSVNYREPSACRGQSQSIADRAISGSRLATIMPTS